MKQCLIFFFIFSIHQNIFAEKHISVTAKAVYNDTVMAPAFNDTIIHWLTVEQAMDAQKKNPKKVLFFIYTTWCRWCRLEDSLVYKNKEISHFINQNFYPVKFNAETRTTVMFKGVPFEFMKDEKIFANALTPYLLNGKMSYPGTVILNEIGTVINVRNGYIEPVYLELVLNYFAGNAYKEMKLEEFDDEFVGKIQE